MKKRVVLMAAGALALTVLFAFTPGKEQKAEAAVPKFEDVLVLGSGSDEGKAVITIVGDGYTKNEQDSFLRTAKEIGNQVSKQYPYRLFKDRLNVHAIKVVSDTSGLQPNTYFQSRFTGSYIKPSELGFKRIEELITAYAPKTLAKIMVSNTNSYSASAYTESRLVTMGAPATMFVTHELGHAAGVLADEYQNANNLMENPNASRNGNAATVRWKDFIGLKNVGMGTRNNWYYPSVDDRDCIMLSGREFCPVCAAALTERLADAAGIPFYGTLYNGISDAAAQKPLNTKTEIRVPDGTDWLPDFSFHGLDRLKTVTIPASVQKIGEYAFLKTVNLTTINNNATRPQDISDGADRFYGVKRANITVNVPAGTKNAYLAAGWTGFKEIREGGSSTTPPITNAQTPILTSQPSDVTVNLGENARLSVTAEVSSGKLSYQWYEVSTNTNTGGKPINGATAATYSPSTSAAGTNYYYVLVKNTDPSVTGEKTAQIATRAAKVTVNAVDNGDNGNNGGTETPGGDNGNTPADTWQPNHPYTAGQTVIYKGLKWRAKWWTTSVPGTGNAWELLSNSNEYMPGKAYVGGDVVIYQGKTWRAKWWTMAVPGSDNSWESK